ncbi:peptide chain release factor 1 [Rhodococcus sp. WMMA185]|nr:alternative ribosome rescue aminoacyl-tRNA hydrolase ArfB [Rhodococcus sp. WMMA185]AOW94227.1 peptide chain release factor 1 [Rhodococcus sp. WMMA185]
MKEYPAQGAVTDDLEITRSLVVPATELHWRFSRSSGPGGQGVNTTDSRVQLAVNISALPALSPEQIESIRTRLAHRLVDGVITVTASDSRSQLRNRWAARARMSALLRNALLIEPRKRLPTTATMGSRRRRLEDKKQRAQTKNLRKKPEI